MGKIEVLDFLRDHPFDWFTIKELSGALGVSERNVRRTVIYLEAHRWVEGRSRGDYAHWNREFRVLLS